MGWAWTLAMNGGLGLGAYWTSKFGLRQPPGYPRVLGLAVLAWGWLTIGMELLGSIGLIARGPLLGWAGVGLAIGLACKLARRSTASPPADRPPVVPTSWEEVVSWGLILWASVVHGGISLFGPVKVISDGPIYHLYFASRWWKAGRLEWVAAPFGEAAATYFPAVGDLWFCWLVTGWGGDLLAKVGQAPFFVIAGLSAMALARRLGAGREASAVASAWFLGSPPLLYFAFEANVDAIFVAGYLLAAYFFVRHGLGDDGPASLVLGGLAAGCAMATKAPGFLFVGPLLAIGTWSAMSRGRSWPSKVGGVLSVLLGAGSVAGFWYVRDAWRAGNPLYPLHLEVGGRAWLVGWYGPGVMRLSPYYLPIGDWRSLGDIILSVVDPRLVPSWLGCLAGAWAWGSARRPTLDRWVWAASGLVVVNLLIYWTVIPYRTQQRFMIQAIGLASIPLARAFDRARSVRFAAVAFLAVHLFTAQTWPFARGVPPWDLSAEVPNDIGGLIPWPVSTFQADSLSYLACGLAAIATVWAVIRVVRSPTARRLAAGLAVVVGFVGLVVATSYPWGASPRRRFFPPFPDYYIGWLELDLRSGPEGSRVAYAGTDLPYYLLGVDLRNEVRYVNIDAHPGWLLHDYQRDALRNNSGPSTWPIPQVGWDRARPDYNGWVTNLRADRIQLLVVVRSKVGWPSYAVDPAGFPIERSWAEAHPDLFEPLYGEAQGDPIFRIYRFKPGAG